MPGKPNCGQLDVCRHFPGTKGYRAWDEGYRRRYGGDGTGDSAKTNTPHAAGTEEFEQDQAGWDRANNNTTGLRYMPNVAPGEPPAGGT